MIIKAAKETVDLTNLDDFSYSCAMRRLRKNDQPNVTKAFQIIFKSLFDKEMLAGNEVNTQDSLMAHSLLLLGKKFKINLSKVSNASEKLSVVRFAEVEPGLFRGSAPTVADCAVLKKKGIKKIVSFDLEAGNEIKQVCKDLGIKHVILPLKMSNFRAVDKLIGMDLKKMFLHGGPTFVHCRHGKDRTGLIVALFRVQEGMTCEDAVKEACTFDFAEGLPIEIKRKYIRTIVQACQDCEDSRGDKNNNFDIVHNQDLEGSIVNPIETMMPSFAPYIYDLNEQQPYGQINSHETRDEFNSGEVYNLFTLDDDNRYIDFRVDNEGAEYPRFNFENIPPVGMFDVQPGLNSSRPSGAVFIGDGVVASEEPKMITKRSYQVQMSYDISDSEKEYARQALQAFEYLMIDVEAFSTHLDLMGIPFKENQDITPEQIWKFRATFRDYRDKAQENLQKVQSTAFKCVQMMNHFMSDTQVEKIMKSFNASIETLTKQFDSFVVLFKSLQAKDFKDNSIKTIDLLKKESAQLKQIIEERVQSVLEKDILAKSWIDNAGNINMKIERKVPFDIQLKNEQHDKVEGKNEIGGPQDLQNLNVSQK